MKKIRFFCLVFCLLLALCGCGSFGNDPTEDDSSHPEPGVVISREEFGNDPLYDYLADLAGGGLDRNSFAGLTSLSLSGFESLTGLDTLVFPALQTLEIENCGLPELGVGEYVTLYYPALRALKISDCGLERLTVTASDLPRLTFLDLSDNGLTDLSGLSSLTTLVELDVSGNPNLSELPEGLRSLTSLSLLDLRGTAVSALPDWIMELPYLSCVLAKPGQITRMPEGFLWLVEAE